MAVAKSDPRRVKDLEAAIDRTKPRDRLKLGELAMMWGTTKPRFVTVRNQMPAFPDPVDKDGNEYIYPALKSLRVMLAYERRHDDLARARQARADAILGRGRKAGGEEDIGAHSPNELATLSRLAAEVEERERLQGLYIHRDQVVTIAGEVFAEISDFGSRLSNEIDPHGRLAPDLRASIDGRARDAVLRCHRIMKDILTADAKHGGTGTAPSRARKPRSRR